MADKAKIFEGRKAIDAYRAAHAKLYLSVDKKGIPEAHTPLLEKLLANLKKQGFSSLDEFFAASETLQDGWQ